ncbi:MAG: porin [Rickettsiales bacterium]|nr:porin [Rickettsiales bacterium]
MKKFLIGTTALIGAAMIAGAAQAEDPKVMVGGVIDFQAGFASQDNDAAQRGHGFRNDTEVSFSVHGKADNGLGYGAVIDLEADVTGDADGEGLNASNTYVFLDGSFGRFEMGSTSGAAETLAVEADNIARGTGGIDGDWTYFANPTGASFITTPALLAEHGSTLAYGSEAFYNSNKINYYSPRFSGFQVGLSYTPDLDDRGQLVARTDTVGSFGDVIEAGLSYEGDLAGFGIAAAATGIWGDAEIAGAQDLEGWNAGLATSYMGVALAGSYGDWGDTLGASTSADYYTLGAAYDFGPFGASVTWLDSEVGTSDFNNLVVSADYSLAPGLTPYAEVSFFDADAAGTASDNDGSVVIIGTELAF